ncbi:hypothetical protein [Streptomyces sp. NPDC001165]
MTQRPGGSGVEEGWDNTEGCEHLQVIPHVRLLVACMPRMVFDRKRTP